MVTPDPDLTRILSGLTRMRAVSTRRSSVDRRSRVSVITVKRAYLELERAGVIMTRQGKGSFVAETQDLPKQIMQDEFNTHLMNMLHSATKLGMHEREVVGQVRASMSINMSDLPRGKNMIVKK